MIMIVFVCVVGDKVVVDFLWEMEYFVCFGLFVFCEMCGFY